MSLAIKIVLLFTGNGIIIWLSAVSSKTDEKSVIRVMDNIKIMKPLNKTKPNTREEIEKKSNDINPPIAV